MKRLPVGTIVIRTDSKYHFFEEKALVAGYRGHNNVHVLKFLYLDRHQKKVLASQSHDGLWGCDRETFELVPEDELTDEDIRLRAVYLLTEGIHAPEDR